MKWIEALGYMLGLLKYVFLAGISLFVVYTIRLLRRNVE